MRVIAFVVEVVVCFVVGFPLRVCVCLCLVHDSRLCAYVLMFLVALLLFVLW